MKKIVSVIGARPQFIKHAPIEIAFKNAVEMITVHTGQHYDHNMSAIFFDDLGLSKPKYQLEVGSLSHAVQTAKMLESLESILIKEKPEFVLLYGDTNSTLAGALAASKMNIKIIHIEAGLRSFNREMPEEINRVLTDHLSTFLFAPTQLAVDNLEKEGITKGVHLVGDVMCDMIEIIKPKLRIVDSEKYYLTTIHRPYNTDDFKRLTAIMNELNQLKYEVVFPMHPRTINYCKLNQINLDDFENIKVIEPQSYLEMMDLLNGSEALITDSGGMQKEAYMLKIKCVTVRSETEWVETLINGWNTLVFEDLNQLKNILDSEPGNYIENIYGDGKASEKIKNYILK